MTTRPLDCIVPTPIETEMSQIRQSYIKRELESERERERVNRKGVERENEGCGMRENEGSLSWCVTWDMHLVKLLCCPSRR